MVRIDFVFHLFIFLLLFFFSSLSFPPRYSCSCCFSPLHVERIGGGHWIVFFVFFLCLLCVFVGVDRVGWESS